MDKQGLAWNAGGNPSEALIDTFKTGCSWFPGYAINIETGERLNIAFGEDSYQASNSLFSNNGNDMMWNPTAALTSTAMTAGGFNYPYQFGGRHYIYVFGHNRSNTKYAGVAADPNGLDVNGKIVGAGIYNDNNFRDMVNTYKWGYSNSFRQTH